ncbi:hypothetical protein [Salinisphaera sp. G21_0]|uniref:hypothetical protein n=1 Tax=Salinisphaera sp. G21_0 TaxID=2821094 RepID=UPI001ADD3B5B|nr:hypothetical protein [Salinisphaera sp. G21_0]MBO9482043.1 hypothetical protein [Salinisphaera sp. G21_0]
MSAPLSPGAVGASIAPDWSANEPAKTTPPFILTFSSLVSVFLLSLSLMISATLT